MVYEGAIQDLAGQRSAFMIPGGHGDGTIATEPDQHGRDTATGSQPRVIEGLDIF